MCIKIKRDYQLSKSPSRTMSLVPPGTSIVLSNSIISTPPPPVSFEHNNTDLLVPFISPRIPSPTLPIHDMNVSSSQSLSTNIADILEALGTYVSVDCFNSTPEIKRSIRTLSKIPLFIKSIDGIDLSDSFLYLDITDQPLVLYSKISISVVIAAESYFTCTHDGFNGSVFPPCNVITKDFEYEAMINHRESLNDKTEQVVSSILQYISDLRYTSACDSLFIGKMAASHLEQINTISSQFVESFNKDDNHIDTAFAECTVCYMYTTTTTNCDHILCHRCISSLLDTRCPVCRSDNVKLKCRSNIGSFTF